MTAKTTLKNPIDEFIKYSPITFGKRMSKEEFTNFYSQFPNLQMERESDGKVKIMSPVKKGSGKREMLVASYISRWYFEEEKGEIYSASTGIELPDSSIKSPDFAWVSEERLAVLPENSDEDYLQAIPDFVVEVRSSTDSLAALKRKMQNVWMANGVRLAWLIDPYSQKVWIYRENEETELVEGFIGKKLNGGKLMPGMEVPLDKLTAKKKK